LATAGAAGAIVYGATMWCIAKHELLDVLGSLRTRRQKNCANEMRNED
jgi:hypothetical protein